MGVRERLNESPKAAALGVAVLVVLLLAVLWSQLRSPGVASGAEGSLYFTTDDGKTTFVDSADKAPPFTVDGKTAVQAVMFTCPHSPKPFVGYLRRGSADARQAGLQPTYELKRPGEATWVSVRSREGGQIRQSVRCPDGKHEPQEVSPE